MAFALECFIPKVILERFIKFAEFVEVCPRGGTKWIAGFGYYCDHGVESETCENCISRTLEEVVKERKLQRAGGVIITEKLKNMKLGQKGKVMKVTARGETNKRIVEMGVIPGTVVEVERIAPLGDPIDIKVKGYHLSLRKDEADKIEVSAL